MPMKRLNIDLADRSYDILINRNLLSKVGEFISKRLEPSRSIIITHPSVRKLFGEKIESGLANVGQSPGVKDSRHTDVRSTPRARVRRWP